LLQALGVNIRASILIRKISEPAWRPERRRIGRGKSEKRHSLGDAGIHYQHSGVVRFQGNADPCARAAKITAA